MDQSCQVWIADYPCTLKCERFLADEFNWVYSQKCAFNDDDSLLLVSGVRRAAGEFMEISSLGDVIIFEISNGQTAYL